MRGQYGNERNLLTGYDKKIFEEEYPKDRVIMECSDLQPELEAHIQRAVGRAKKHLMQNQKRSWARRVACWNDMKDSLEDAIKIGGNLLASEGNIVESCDDEEQEIVNRANKIEAHLWFDVYRWAIENDRFSARERKFVSNIYISVHRGKKFRKVNQAEGALGLMEKTKRLGFDKWLDIMNKEKAELENKEQSKK